jgi:predicted negative regulator of RcsB-dependent stress response
MSNKGSIITLSIIVVGSYVAFFLYQRNQRRIANERVVSYEQAIIMLNEAKGE